MELMLNILADSILGTTKAWLGMDFFLKAIPTPIYEDIIIFKAYILSKTMQKIENLITLRKSYLQDARVVLNMSKFFEILVDRVYKGCYHILLII